MKNECCIKTIKQIEEWLKERTYEKIIDDGRLKLVRFMPWEFAEFKSKLIGEKE